MNSASRGERLSGTQKELEDEARHFVVTLRPAYYARRARQLKVVKPLGSCERDLEEQPPELQGSPVPSLRFRRAEGVFP
jgi:hypothetical protein